MADYNKVILVGNLTRDPQLSYLPNQTPVCEFGLASNRKWTDAQGQQRQEVCFIDCRVYARQAETFNKYMSKGRPVLVEGELQFDQWENQGGEKRSKHRIRVHRFVFLGDSGNEQPQGQPQAQAPAPPPPPAPVDGVSADDIPF